MENVLLPNKIAINRTSYGMYTIESEYEGIGSKKVNIYVDSFEDEPELTDAIEMLFKKHGIELEK